VNGDPDKIVHLIKNLVDQGGGQLTIAYDPELEPTPWVVGSTFGREAEDSPMAGGAVYGAAADLGEALDQALADLGFRESRD
jgi:hypothetical protein